MAQMKKALVSCRTGMGSSMMLKIKVEQVCAKNDFPLEVEHDVMDAIPNFKGDLLITMSDLADDIRAEGYPFYIIGINNLMDKQEIEDKIREFFASQA